MSTGDRTVEEFRASIPIANVEIAANIRQVTSHSGTTYQQVKPGKWYRDIRVNIFTVEKRYHFRHL
jgi:hypothetical protein